MKPLSFPISTLSSHIRYVLLTICLMPACATFGQMSIDGTFVGYDKHSNTFLATMPKEQWGKECTMTVTIADTLWKDTKVNGQTIETPVLLDTIAPGKTFPVTATVGDSLINALLEFTYLPMIFLQGEFGYEDTLGTVTLQEPGTKPKEMLAKVRWRGATTNQPFKHKRNYKLGFVNKGGDKDNKKFFSLRKDDDWILDSGQMDIFRLRNHIASELWDDFATKPYYADEDMEVHTSSRGEVVEVFLNNEYAGIYNLCEPIDQKQLQVKKFNSNTGEIHGQIWKSVGWDGTTFESLPPPFDNTSPQWNDFELKYPEIDDLCPSDYSTLCNAIDFVANASKEEFKEQISDYIDLPVFYDYILFINILDAFDVAGKNLYWAVYDKEESKKMTLTVWDLDDTMGQSFSHNPPPHPDYVSYDSWPLLPTRIATQLFLLNYDQFRSRIAERYFNLRKDVFSFTSLFGRYQSHYDLINDCGATKREERRWSGDDDIMGLTIDFAQELEFIHDWLESRLDHLDTFFSGPVNIGQMKLEISDDKEYTPNGQVAGDSYRGIVVTKDGKYFRR